MAVTWFKWNQPPSHCNILADSTKCKSAHLMNKHDFYAVNIWVHLKVWYVCLLTHVHYSHCSVFGGGCSLKCRSDKQSAEWDKYLLILNICLLKVACHWPHPSRDAPPPHTHTMAEGRWQSDHSQFYHQLKVSTLNVTHLLGQWMQELERFCIDKPVKQKWQV